jgi:Kef-type K+ transport system membrane component KefB
MSKEIVNNIIKRLHTRDAPLFRVLVANILVAVLLFIFLIAVLIVLIIEGGDSKTKAVLDYIVELLFFASVILLLVGELLADRKLYSLI